MRYGYGSFITPVLSRKYASFAVYVTISKQYILPGLDRLSDLTTGSAVAAQANYADFQKWEREAVLGTSDIILQVSIALAVLRISFALHLSGEMDGLSFSL